ncbi:MAG: class I SAM-dependent methyltransferase [Bdellovibrionales bacterium]
MSVFLADEHPLNEELSLWVDRHGWTKDRHLVPGVQLEWRDQILSLCHRDKRLPAVYVNFIHLWRSTQISKQDPFAKALGLRHGLKNVVDATAGLGGDLIKLLKLGCTVTAIESSPVVFALLLDGQRRAMNDERWVNGGSKRLTLQFGEAEKILPRLAAEICDVIYLDPMFPEKSKTALSKGEMQIMQELFSDSQDNLSSLLRAAREKANKRVVLKRPRLAAKVEPAPNLDFLGNSVRYDVWLRSTL